MRKPTQAQRLMFAILALTIPVEAITMTVNGWWTTPSIVYPATAVLCTLMFACGYKNSERALTPLGVVTAVALISVVFIDRGAGAAISATLLLAFAAAGAIWFVEEIDKIFFTNNAARNAAD